MITHNFSSASRTRGVIENFQIDLAAPITCRSVRVDKIEMQNTLYNIGAKNYRIFMDTGLGGDPYIYLTEGTYTASQICAMLQAKMRFHGMGISGNSVSFANYKFTISSNTSFTIKPIPDGYDFASTMGFTSTHTGTSATSDVQLYTDVDQYIVQGSTVSSTLRFAYDGVDYTYVIPDGNYDGYDIAELLTARLNTVIGAQGITVEYKNENLSFQFTSLADMIVYDVNALQSWFGPGSPFTIPANTPTLIPNYQFYQVSHVLVKSWALTNQRPVVLGQTIAKVQMDTVYGNTTYEKNLDLITYDRPTTISTIDLRLEDPSGRIQEIQHDWNISLVFEI
jgi:hypothetical protein